MKSRMLAKQGVMEQRRPDESQPPFEDDEDEIESSKRNVQIKKNIKNLYDKIESIRGTISMANAERAELWIQRQNLQDLYHQIILSDIDFVIDKKLEQELWNNVFKAQINYFQTQIRENSGSGSSQVGVGPSQSSSSSVAGSTGSSTFSITAQQQKKLEYQANLTLFLESARGFYTRLLEDILLKYELTELGRSLNLVTVSANRRTSRKANRTTTPKKDDQPTEDEKKLKQLYYICQHILTHLGDIARYQSFYDEAKQYYLHAVRLVPYLGHPYNQLGILFETTRTNQLATVFYYMRSLAVRYAFPLATTNLENFFNKIVDVPLSRYMPSIITSGGENKSVAIKLPHMELVALFLQINATIYLSGKRSSATEAKLTQLIELFKSSFVAFIQTPAQKERLDALQLTQMISIVVFHLNTDKNEPRHRLALDLLFFFVEQLVYLSSEDPDALTLAPLQIALAFLVHYKSGRFVANNNDVWRSSSNVEKYVRCVVKCANEWRVRRTGDNEAFNSCDFNRALIEDRLVESYLPMKDAHKDINFKWDIPGSLDEKRLRRGRLVDLIEKLVNLSSNESYIKILREGEENRFVLSEHCIVEKSTTINEEKSSLQIDEDKSSKQVQPVAQPARKRRQNVAIASITGENQQQIEKIQAQSASKQPTQTITTQKQQTPPPTSQQQQQQQQARASSNPSYFPSASTSSRHQLIGSQQISAFPPPPSSISNPNQIPQASLLNNPINNGFPTFLPGVDNFRMSELINKLKVSATTATQPQLNRTPANQQEDALKWLIQQQQQGNLNTGAPLTQQQQLVEFMMKNHSINNNTSNNIWSLGSFPSANNANNLSGADSSSSWQKPLKTSNSTNMGFQAPVNNLNQLFATNSALNGPSVSHKDEQKSFEFNLNMINMIHNTMTTSPIPGQDSSMPSTNSIWSGFNNTNNNNAAKNNNDNRNQPRK